MNNAVPKLARCAVYTRKSTEHNLDLTFTSLDAQREACEAYIRSQSGEGWRLLPDHYDDGGLSGASLDRATLKLLDGVARRNGPSERNLKIGTVLVRDYQGRRHTVTVESQGYVWEGQAYSSLSAIARAITGTAWSGPRFFTLKSSAAQDAAQDRRAARHHRQSQPSTGASKSRPRNPIRTY